MITLLWVLAVVLIVFWLFGLVLDLIGTLIWLFLVAGAILLAIALFRTLTGGRSV
ncbi:MAG: DUF5670 family protein [Dehalococcoidia bacterium]